MTKPRLPILLHQPQIIIFVGMVALLGLARGCEVEPCGSNGALNEVGGCVCNSGYYGNCCEYQTLSLQFKKPPEEDIRLSAVEITGLVIGWLIVLPVCMIIIFCLAYRHRQTTTTAQVGTERDGLKVDHSVRMKSRTSPLNSYDYSSRSGTLSHSHYNEEEFDGDVDGSGEIDDDNDDDDFKTLSSSRRSSRRHSRSKSRGAPTLFAPLQERIFVIDEVDPTKEVTSLKNRSLDLERGTGDFDYEEDGVSPKDRRSFLPSRRTSKSGYRVRQGSKSVTETDDAVAGFVAAIHMTDRSDESSPTLGIPSNRYHPHNPVITLTDAGQSDSDSSEDSLKVPIDQIEAIKGITSPNLIAKKLGELRDKKLVDFYVGTDRKSSDSESPDVVDHSERKYLTNEENEAKLQRNRKVSAPVGRGNIFVINERDEEEHDGMLSKETGVTKSDYGFASTATLMLNQDEAATTENRVANGTKETSDGEGEELKNHDGPTLTKEFSSTQTINYETTEGTTVSKEEHH
mmetsp:Transcript_60692/g.69339  ORF Transcript_60692/g.69339 Transcript_60692/m.69339 type:complete len:515 (-) Transcript_60692:476-2020(-)